jgi:hypothetical protein
MKRFHSLVTSILMSGLCAAACLAQTSSAPNGPAVQVVITAEPRHGKEVPPITQNDVTVTSGRDKLDVLEVVPAQGERGALQLLLLLDDSSNTNLGTQLPSLKQFINGLPPNAAIAVGYMRNGTVLFAQDFTNDHAAAATKLRLPMGQPGADTSPWFSLSDLFKKWRPTGARREILMISDGIDRFGGGGPDNPYVNEAVAQAQRGGFIVSSIYWNGVGHYGHSFYRFNWGQNYLSEIADATGGEAYWQGFGDPVSFSPYLEDFMQRINNQYIVTFRPKLNKKAGLEQIKVRTELQNVELVGPTQVMAPAM